MIAFADMYFYIKEQKLKGRGTCRKSDIEVNLLSYQTLQLITSLRKTTWPLGIAITRGSLGWKDDSGAKVFTAILMA